MMKQKTHQKQTQPPRNEKIKKKEETTHWVGNWYQRHATTTKILSQEETVTTNDAPIHRQQPEHLCIGWLNYLAPTRRMFWGNNTPILERERDGSRGNYLFAGRGKAGRGMGESSWRLMLEWWMENKSLKNGFQLSLRESLHRKIHDARRCTARL